MMSCEREVVKKKTSLNSMLYSELRCTELHPKTFLFVVLHKNADMGLIHDGLVFLQGGCTGVFMYCAGSSIHFNWVAAAVRTQLLLSICQPTVCVWGHSHSILRAAAVRVQPLQPNGNAWNKCIPLQLKHSFRTGVCCTMPV